MGETPYSVYGTKAVIPIEIGMPSFRTTNFDKKTNEMEQRLTLNFLGEKREHAQVRQFAYKHQVAKYFDRRVKHRSLRKVTLATKELNVRKHGPTWEGAYKVVKVYRSGTYCLDDMGERILPHNWHV